jgi:hypothetical protein
LPALPWISARRHHPRPSPAAATAQDLRLRHRLGSAKSELTASGLGGSAARGGAPPPPRRWARWQAAQLPRRRARRRAEELGSTAYTSIAPPLWTTQAEEGAVREHEPWQQVRAPPPAGASAAAAACGRELGSELRRRRREFCCRDPRVRAPPVLVAGPIGTSSAARTGNRHPRACRRRGRRRKGSTASGGCSGGELRSELRSELRPGARSAAGELCEETEMTA